jgi:hypothetical protein
MQPVSLSDIKPINALGLGTSDPSCQIDYG